MKQIPKLYETWYDWHNATVDSEIWRIRWEDYDFKFSGVYLITPENKWPCKVGVSKDAYFRLQQLQTANWNRLRVAKYWICENQKEAQRLEKKAHEILAESNRTMVGEWFDIREEKAAEVIDFAAEIAGIDATDKLPKSSMFDEIREDLVELRWEMLQHQGSLEAAALRGDDGPDHIDYTTGKKFKIV